MAFAEELAGPNAPGAEPLHRWSVDFMVTAAVESVLGWLEHGDAAYDDDFVALATEGLRGMIVAWAGAGTGAGAGGRVTTAGAGAPPPPAGSSSASQSAGAARGSTTNFDAPMAM